MNPGKDNVTQMIDMIKTKYRKNEKSSYLLIGFFAILIGIAILLYAKEGQSGELWIIGIFVLIIAGILVKIILKQKKFKEMIEWIHGNQEEINQDCEFMEDNCYATKYRVIKIYPEACKLEQVEFNQIQKIEDSRFVNTDNMQDIPALTITTMDQKKYKWRKTDRLDCILHDDKREEEESEGVKMASSDIKDYYQYDDYQQGFIDVDLLNAKDVSMWMDTDIEESYANQVAHTIKTLTREEIEEALESTVWFYNDNLKEDGYFNKELPLRMTKEEVLNYITLNEIYPRKEENQRICYTLFFHTEMEPEHGISWGFEDKELIYVGAGADYAEENLKDDYNYAKKYHDPVTLTEEEYKELEETGKITKKKTGE